MPEYKVKQENCLSSIAERHGLTLEKVAYGGWDWNVDRDICYRCYVFPEARTI